MIEETAHPLKRRSASFVDHPIFSFSRHDVKAGDSNDVFCDAPETGRNYGEKPSMHRRNSFSVVVNQDGAIEKYPHNDQVSNLNEYKDYEAELGKHGLPSACIFVAK